MPRLKEVHPLVTTVTAMCVCNPDRLPVEINPPRHSPNSLALVILSFVLWNFWLLAGVLLAVIGFLFSSPAVMKGFGSFLLLVIGGYFIYSCIKGHQTAAFLSGAYAVSNFLTSLSREYCDSIARRVIEQSELLLVWLALKKVVIVRRR